ncbi:hypothetical protein C2869_16935 [Saccharobesus litoralis]|uniref:ABC transporter domain-containing protein n=1 Tax=Saccharobesus litoralis TaxID=2172099 RepID=A0A2S0VUY1_9ALTE|nr:ATP-binding cassette domain-containing protein [Saccharobesus litoralis]AWB68005.1 hypothetical protein C2869_16935 [Saccharobesus litoralis]
MQIQFRDVQLASQRALPLCRIQNQGFSHLIESGQTVVFSGPSGCGKSLLFSTLVGLHKPAAGNIYFNELDVYAAESKALDELKCRMGVVFDVPALLSNQTVEQNLMLCADWFFVDETYAQRKHRVNQLAKEYDFFNLLPLRPNQLSLAEASLIAVARALFHQPQVLIWDSVFHGIETSKKSFLLNKLQQLKSRGSSLILFTNARQDLADLPHQLIELDSRDKEQN